MKISSLNTIKVIAIGATCFITCAGTTVASAAVLYSNYSYMDNSTTTGRSVAGTSTHGGGNNPAYTFVSASSGSVSEIDLALSIMSGSVTATLWTAAIGCGTGADISQCSNLVPTTELGSWSVSASPSTFKSITGITGVSLTQGTTYFMELISGTPTTQATWWDNAEGATGQLWQCGGSNSSYTTCTGYHNIYGAVTSGAFSVLSANPVPLPATAWLMLSSFGGLATFARKRCS